MQRKHGPGVKARRRYGLERRDAVIAFERPNRRGAGVLRSIAETPSPTSPPPSPGTMKLAGSRGATRRP